MMGFPPSDHFEGPGVFSHCVKLDYPLRPNQVNCLAPPPLTAWVRARVKVRALGLGLGLGTTHAPHPFLRLALTVASPPI